MSIEQGPNESEKSFEEKIIDFKGSFEGLDPKLAGQLKEELLEMAGLKESELADPQAGFDLGLMKIPVNELSSFSTACGTKGNKPFSAQAIDFLRARDVDFIVALGENREPLLSSAAINLIREDAEKFEEIINSGLGSLRAEKSRLTGWSVFESE